MKLSKYFAPLVLALAFTSTTSATAYPQIQNMTHEQRAQIIKNIPKRLAVSWPQVVRDPYILACMSSANAGNDASLASLMIIADSADVIKARTTILENAKKESKTTKELYTKMQKFNTIANLKKMKLAASELPDALDYCRKINNKIYSDQGKVFDPVANFAESYININNK